MTYHLIPAEDRPPVPWLRPQPLGRLAVKSALVAAPFAYAAHRLGRPPSAVTTVEVAWVVASVVAQEQVQRALGGGRLDGRVPLRMVVAAACFNAFLGGLGATFLLPLASVVVGVPQIAWSGPRSWRTCAATFAAATTLSQAAVLSGLVDGLVRPGLSAVLAAVGTAGATATLFWSGAAAAHREERSRHLEHVARTDSLTGVLSRAAVLADLERRLRDVVPPDRVGVLYCDLDGFKQVNDTLGHLAGDVVLREVAQRVAAALPGGGVVGRLGGDEFLVVVGPGPDGGHLAVADAVRAAVSRPVEVDGRAVVVGVSIGTTSAGSGEATDDVMTRADAAMYARRAGAPDGLRRAAGAAGPGAPPGASGAAPATTPRERLS